MATLMTFFNLGNDYGCSGGKAASKENVGRGMCGHENQGLST
jgi:hypothetical protein